ncbi:hypothetical protein [Mycoplasmopsis anatis]|uniref:hypothetical protein n=1 Tax=Mycoplasmopsis anatis TaxID=171279 RepID=UPI0034DCF964
MNCIIKLPENLFINTSKEFKKKLIITFSVMKISKTLLKNLEKESKFNISIDMLKKRTLEKKFTSNY